MPGNSQDPAQTMAKRKKTKGSPDKKRGGGTSKLLLRVANAGRKSGFTTVDFTFLLDWLGRQGAERFLRAIELYGRRYVAAQCTYSVRAVLKFWHQLGASQGWPLPSSLSPADLLRQLSQLRREFYSAQTAQGKALSTTTNNWDHFLRLTTTLVASKAIKNVEPKSAAIAAPARCLVVADRQTAANAAVAMSNAPRTLNAAMDSYNDNLLEPISIIDGSQTYLNNYQKSLGAAVNEIRRCALKDFEVLEAKREIGKEEIARFDQDLVSQFRSDSRYRYTDRSSGRQLLGPYGSKVSLGTVLGIVHYEMGGIPKPRRSYGSKQNSNIAEGSHPHWIHVAWFGKNELLPYLGIMSSMQAAVCMVLLILEHPSLNPTALYRAKIERPRSGGAFITSSGLLNGGKVRFDVEKLRAGEEKSAELSPLAQRVLAKVVEWTDPVRAEMRAQGTRQRGCLQDSRTRPVSRKDPPCVCRCQPGQLP